MIETRFRLEPANWSNQSDQAFLREVRENVFIVEQNIPPEEEWDELDQKSHHVLAFDENNQPIACGRLTPDNHIGRMAVIKAWRGQHLGAAIFQHLLDLARSLHRAEIILHAQSYAVPFYEKFGFQTIGDEFIECDIPHIKMRLNLTQADSRTDYRHTVNRAQNVQAIAESKLASVLVKFDTAANAADAIMQTAHDARHRVWIYARELDQLMHRAEFVERLKQVALSARQASVQILLLDLGSAVRDEHPILQLRRRIPSALEIRVPSREEDFQYPSAYVINDNGGYVFRTLASRFEGESNRNNAPRQRQLLNHFEEIWQRALVPPDLHHVPL